MKPVLHGILFNIDPESQTNNFGRSDCYFSWVVDESKSSKQHPGKQSFCPSLLDLMLNRLLQAIDYF